MGTRRQARENALQILYQIEMSKDTLPDVLENFWTRHGDLEEELKTFAIYLVKGVLDEKEAIDALIVKYSTHWKLPRMATVDKNILRLAVFELKNCQDIPLKVSLNEAIEIAKKYGSEDSSAFINGVLDKVAKELKKEE